MTCCAMMTRRAPSCWPTGASSRLSWEYGPTLADKPLAQFSRAEDEACRLRPNRLNQVASGFNWLAWCSQRRPFLVRLGGAFAVLALGLGVFLVTRLRSSQPELLAVVTGCLGEQMADSRGALPHGASPGPRTAHSGGRHGGSDDSKRCPDPLGRARHLELLTPLRAYLQAGRAVVHVPEAASGFVIETRDANVWMWHRFGIKVGPDRGTEVQVYQGSVFTSAKSAGGRTNGPQRLLAGRAVRLDADATDTLQNLPFAPDRFVRQLPETKSGNKDTLPLWNQPRWDRVEIMPASQPVVADGNLSEWDRQGCSTASATVPRTTASRAR